MPKATQEPQGSGLSGQTTPLETEDQTRRYKSQPKASQPKESKVHRLSHGKELYTPKKRDRKTPSTLTVDQYLRKQRLDEGISGLIRYLHKTKVMSFDEWEREAAALLKKKTW